MEIALRSVQASKWIVELPVPYVEVRPTRALMFKKIYFNVRAFNRLRRVFQLAYRPVRALNHHCRVARAAPPRTQDGSAQAAVDRADARDPLPALGEIPAWHRDQSRAMPRLASHKARRGKCVWDRDGLVASTPHSTRNSKTNGESAVPTAISSLP